MVGININFFLKLAKLKFIQILQLFMFNVMNLIMHYTI